ncbi:MAG: hypothetical protein KAG28_05155 [Cocleimonas sp.]|nr:hypothetical protein [Cocleimonas sp.]
MKTCRFQHPKIFLFCGLLFLCSACADSEGDEEQIVEGVVPLSCLYPGKLQLETQTQGVLTQYQHSPTLKPSH